MKYPSDHSAIPMGTRSKSWCDFLEMILRCTYETSWTWGTVVSQSLPVLTELLSDSAPSTYLLQQPEVHLHPTAQAALGSLFCNIAAKGVQMLVETHSDYLLDRVRMDVRDGKGEQALKPEDVSILYFERFGASVRIYPIWLDENGNVRDAPNSYGEFFMAESRRSIGL